MYAITSISYRAISDAADAQPGETVVDVIPASLLSTLLAGEMRRQRDALIASCDWTQMPDAPLPAATKALWAAYRQALREVPEQAGFPTMISWPVAP